MRCKAHVLPHAIDKKKDPKRGPPVMARSTGLEPAAYRVGGVVGSRMARVSEIIVLVIDKFGKGERGFKKVFKNLSEGDFSRSRKK